MKIMRIYSLIIACAVVVVLGGCVTHVDCGDCIPRSKMPYTLNDRGTNYQILDHQCVADLLRVEMGIYQTRSGIYQRLKEKFPKDSELMAYIDGIEKRYKKLGEPKTNLLLKFQKQLETSGGESYSYSLHYDKPVPSPDGSTNLLESENGFLILSKGKVINKIEESYTVK